MAQNISLWNATYSDVPAVNLPKSGGGTARFTDTSVTTAVESDVASGKIFIKADGSQGTGTATGGSGAGYVWQDAQGYVHLSPTGGGGSSTLIAKTITLNGTYDAEDDNADGYSAVTVNVQGGAAVTETQGTYGTEVVVTSGSAPSATQHTIYFEFTDETDETIIGYWNGTFISDAVTATTPTTYGQKTVTLAQLDGVTWYSYTPPTPGQWETVWSGQANTVPEDPYPYFWISDMSSVYPTEGEVWRVTINNTEYVVTAFLELSSNTVMLGNTLYWNGTDNGVNAPFCLYNAGYGAFMGNADLTPSTTYNLKFEKSVTGE